jgi:hypothetical protein
MKQPSGIQCRVVSLKQTCFRDASCPHYQADDGGSTHLGDVYILHGGISGNVVIFILASVRI